MPTAPSTPRRSSPDLYAEMYASSFTLEGREDNILIEAAEQQHPQSASLTPQNLVDNITWEAAEQAHPQNASYPLEDPADNILIETAEQQHPQSASLAPQNLADNILVETAEQQWPQSALSSTFNSPRRPRPPPNSPNNSISPSGQRLDAPYISLNAELSGLVTAMTPPPTKSLVDYRALTYLGEVDENLICPICKVALIDPVDTECHHTFCKECISVSLGSSHICPIDRIPLSKDLPFERTNIIIANQLDALLVKCMDCDASIPRAMLVNHLERYCKEGLVSCPDTSCSLEVKRKIADLGDCLHYNVNCPDCNIVLQRIDRHDHREFVCEKREKECNYCGDPVLRCKEVEHVALCPDVSAHCQWADYGCQHESKRKYLPDHDEKCAFKLVGPMANMLKVEIHSLRGELQTMGEKNTMQERRLRFLESEIGLSFRPEPPEMTRQGSMSSAFSDPVNSDTFDATAEYLLNLVGDQDRKLDQLGIAMKEMEAKQSMVFFNETINIKQELGELRSQQQVQGMHVRWLMQFRRQEQNQQKRFGGGNGSGSGSNGDQDGNGSGQRGLPRRLSDSTRDLVTKL